MQHDLVDRRAAARADDTFPRALPVTSGVSLGAAVNSMSTTLRCVAALPDRPLGTDFAREQELHVKFLTYDG